MLLATHPLAYPNTATGPRAVLGSQQPRTGHGEQVVSAPPLQSHALRAKDGSRSAPCARSPSTLSSFLAFTLLELMIVVSIMGLVLTMGVPIVYRMRHESALRKAVKDVVEVCSQARAIAILQSKATCVVFHPREGSFAVQGGAKLSGDNPVNPVSFSVESSSKESGLSGQLSDRVAIDMLDVDLTEYKDAEEVKVWFYPNGVCDELTLILHALDIERDPLRAISLEVTTGLASVETDINKLRSLKK